MRMCMCMCMCVYVYVCARACVRAWTHQTIITSSVNKPSAAFALLTGAETKRAVQERSSPNVNLLICGLRRKGVGVEVEVGKLDDSWQQDGGVDSALVVGRAKDCLEQRE